MEELKKLILGSIPIWMPLIWGFKPKDIKCINIPMGNENFTLYYTTGYR
jgi:hypothetical protein